MAQAFLEDYRNQRAAWTNVHYPCKLEIADFTTDVEVATPANSDSTMTQESDLGDFMQFLLFYCLP